MPGAWDWRVEHENATGSAKSEIEILVTRNHMDSELSCLVNSSAMKVSLVQKDLDHRFDSDIIAHYCKSLAFIIFFQKPFTTRVNLDVNVSPSQLMMNPENNQIEEGGKVSVTCTAIQVRLTRNSVLLIFSNFIISACRCKPIILSRTYFFSSCPQCLIGQVLENKMCCSASAQKLQ